MKTNKSILILCMLLLIGAQSLNPELEGVWRGVFSDQGASGELFYHFVVNGNSISGKMENGEQELNFAKGKITGRSFTFTIEFEQLQLVHEGVLNRNDTITLTTYNKDYPDDSRVMTLERVTD